MHSDLHTTSSSSLPPANLEFDNRPFQIRSTLIYSLNKSPWTILELGSNFTDFFHEFRECIVYRERNEIRNEKKKKKKKKKKRKKKEGKKERELENRCHRARSHVSLEVDVSLRLDSLRIHLVRPRISLEPEKRGSVPWLADPVLTQKCTQHFPRKFLIICPELPLTIELRNCKLFERKYHTLCQVGQQETGEIVTSRVFHGHWFASWSVLSQVEFIFMYRKGRIYTSLRFLESDSRIFLF